MQLAGGVVAPPVSGLADVLAILSLVGDSAAVARVVSAVKDEVDRLHAVVAEAAAQKVELKSAAEVLQARSDALDERQRVVATLELKVDAQRVDVERRSSALDSRELGLLNREKALEVASVVSASKWHEKDSDLRGREAALAAAQEALTAERAALKHDRADYDARVKRLKEITG